MKTYALRIDNWLFKVQGSVNPKGNLAWFSADDIGEIMPTTKPNCQARFSLWDERKQAFPDCVDYK